jgi:hypothetical protein
MCAARENRTLHVQYPFVDISCRFALEISHKGFDSRYALYAQSYASGRTTQKPPGGGFFSWCGQRESNSHLIVGNDMFYHLTMAALFTF